MPLQLLPMQAVDLPHYVKIVRDAFEARDTTLSHVIYPNGMTPPAMAWYQEVQRKGLLDPSSQYNIVVDTDIGEIISVAKWKIHSTEQSEDAMDREEADARRDRLSQEAVEGVRFDVVNAFRDAQAACKREILGGRPFVYLSTLATAPKHERRGAGALHLQWGIAKAAELGIPMYLESTTGGKALYERFGFKGVRTLSADAREFGSSNACVHWCMLRE